MLFTPLTIVTDRITAGVETLLRGVSVILATELRLRSGLLAATT
jgi:hypothetical protein